MRTCVRAPTEALSDRPMRVAGSGRASGRPGRDPAGLSPHPGSPSHTRTQPLVRAADPQRPTCRPARRTDRQGIRPPLDGAIRLDRATVGGGGRGGAHPPTHSFMA
jgi:hypothetical protein